MDLSAALEFEFSAGGFLSNDVADIADKDCVFYL
jgi:hypothetical protein